LKMDSVKDRELLHIAVEVGSLRGVRWTAVPRMVKLKDDNNRTALELAEETLGEGHEITECLNRVVDNLTHCGFFKS